MLNLACTKGNNSTDVHMLQRDNKDGGFRIRTSPGTLRRFTSVEVNPVHRGLFKGKK